jgi:uroporphyrinogen-III synthase
VVLTREAGKNGQLLAALQRQGVACLEMPLLETAKGPDRCVEGRRTSPLLSSAARVSSGHVYVRASPSRRDELPVALREEQFDWVCITSPEAASVFVEGWRAAGRPAVRVAVVGDGTGRVLRAAEGDALEPAFAPSVANAEHFAPELPLLAGGSNRVLYPASNKASSQLQEGLAARGFAVRRLNTYDTLPVQALDPGELALARGAAVVAVASPSAVRAWVQFAGEGAAARVAVACIGGTSARAAKKLGLANVFFPQEPSVDNFAAAILEALAASGR